ncbi:hypothetical protein SteCoe_29771 [Stentor coeruleus]|uniref:TRP C-terminal domain-containing protein n=1 Tax=Stentor coeruleus TaxID=5963 RepID=A0A1R2B546_9CILI|nr:hypothetical protein SteCoe_29771 [Stentor coeruleus]
MTSIENFDLILSSLTLIFEFCGFVLLIHLVLQRRKLKLDEEASFIQHFGTFFNEFRVESQVYWLHYILFFIKRLTVACCAIFIIQGIIQLTLTFIVCLASFFYLLSVRPFLNPIVGWTLIISECLTCIFYAILGISCLCRLAVNSKNAQMIAMYILLASLALNAASSGLNTVKSLYDTLKLRKCKNVKVEAINTMVDFNQPKNDFDKP